MLSHDLAYVHMTRAEREALLDRIDGHTPHDELAARSALYRPTGNVTVAPLRCPINEQEAAA